ncbi:MAG: holin family protein [Bacteroidales bacterium]|nr:holin family protein [Bacteroidales bacterium]
MKPIFKFVTSLFEPATKLIDEIFTSDEERLKYGNELAGLKNELARIQNEISTKIVNYETKLLETKQKLVHGEITGNWLQRSWRPIVMLAFATIVIYQYFLAPLFGASKIDFLPDRFWTLLELGIGGYVAGRSLEKMVPQVTKAVTEGREKARIEKAKENNTIPQVEVKPDIHELSRRDIRRYERKRRGEERRRKRAERKANKD